LNIPLANSISKLTLKINDFFKVNLSVLIILCLISQHSFIVKFFGVFLVVILNLNSLKEFSIRKIPFFYFLIIITEVLKFLFFNDTQNLPHFAQFILGITYWLASLILCWILYYVVNNELYIKKSINVFVVLNFAFSIYQLVKICCVENVLNPFNTGHNHPYGISSGDLISGIFHGVHLTNAFVSLFLIIYYITEQTPLYIFLSLTTLLLTGSNYATIILFLAFGILFFSNKSNWQKVSIILCVIFIVVFYSFVTPLNAEYLLEKTLNISKTLPNSAHDIALEDLESKYEVKKVTIADTNSPYTSEGAETKKIIVKNQDNVFDFVKQSGKTRSYYQTKEFLTQSAKNFMLGSGIGGFSSKLAFNSSGIMEGSSLNKYFPKYESSYFGNNHKALYAYLKTQHIMFHSESNRPFSVYNQLLGEYGIIGFSFFILFYLWYFIKRMDLKTYALPVFVALLLMLNIDYFFESISILLFFELLMFLNIKQKIDSEHAV
jgi:hypothetical protein